MITKQQLLDDGCQRNPNMWIGPGWLFCRGCQRYTYCVAFSHPGTTDCYELCLQCNEYHGNLQLKGSAMPVAADILASAKEFTERYATTITTQDLTPPMPKQVVLQGVLPARVYVLLQSGTVLGVLTNEQRALDEAHSLMTAYGGEWEQMSPHRIWRGGNGVYVEISAHDVR